MATVNFGHKKTQPKLGRCVGYTVRNVNEMMTTFHGVTIGDTYIEAATRNEREDALLIAAAPDLLEALQELVFLYEHDEGCRELTEYKRAKAAISKALGEE